MIDDDHPQSSPCFSGLTIQAAICLSTPWLFKVDDAVPPSHHLLFVRTTLVVRDLCALFLAEATEMPPAPRIVLQQVQETVLPGDAF